MRRKINILLAILALLVASIACDGGGVKCPVGYATTFSSPDICVNITNTKSSEKLNDVFWTIFTPQK